MNKQELIVRCANEVLAVHRGREKLSVHHAIRRVIENYKGLTKTEVAQELNQRSQSVKKRSSPVPFVQIAQKKPVRSKTKLDIFWEMRHRGCALAHENQLRGGFELADHLDDY